MKNKEVKNRSKTLLNPISIKICESFLCKLRGYTFRAGIKEDQGLLLVEEIQSRIATSIHMVFVFFKLGIVWINDDGIVVDTRIAYPFISFQIPKAPAKFVLEISPQRLKEFSIGDKIEFI